MLGIRPNEIWSPEVEQLKHALLLVPDLETRSRPFSPEVAEKLYNVAHSILPSGARRSFFTIFPMRIQVNQTQNQNKSYR